VVPADSGPCTPPFVGDFFKLDSATPPQKNSDHVRNWKDGTFQPFLLEGFFHQREVLAKAPPSSSPFFFFFFFFNPTEELTPLYGGVSPRRPCFEKLLTFPLPALFLFPSLPLLCVSLSRLSDCLWTGQVIAFILFFFLFAAGSFLSLKGRSGFWMAFLFSQFPLPPFFVRFFPFKDGI